MIPPRVHATLDGLSAAALATGPSLLGWRPGLRAACAAAGAGVAAYSLATRYHGRSRAPLSMDQHLAIDAVQGLGFCAAAAALRVERGGVRATLAGYGLFSIAAALLTDLPVGHARLGRRRRTRRGQVRGSQDEPAARTIYRGDRKRRGA